MLLIKFLNKNHLDDLIQGKIYMSPLSYFIKLEENSKERGQGDRYEGCLHIDQTMNAKFLGNNVKVSNIEFKIDTDINYLTSCYYNVDRDRIKKEDDKYVFKFTNLEIKEFINWGDVAVIINKELFLKRIKRNLIDKGLCAKGKKVKYYNPQEPGIDILNDFNNTDDNIDRLFWKDKYFENQNEFRIITAEQSSQGKTGIDIGDISDISEVFDSKTLLEEGFFLKLPKDYVVGIKK